MSLCRYNLWLSDVVFCICNIYFRLSKFGSLCLSLFCLCLSNLFACNKLIAVLGIHIMLLLMIYYFFVHFVTLHFASAGPYTLGSGGRETRGEIRGGASPPMIFWSKHKIEKHKIFTCE